MNFYGPCSEYVVSGSDCGNIFFWDKQTEAIVQCMPGDEKGVVSAGSNPGMAGSFGFPPQCKSSRAQGG